MVFNAPNLILFFLNKQMFEVVFLEDSISLYNEKSKCENASILRKYGSICMWEKPRLFYNITEDVKARKVNAFENFPAFDLIAFIVVVFYERNSDNGLICITTVHENQLTYCVIPYKY